MCARRYSTNLDSFSATLRRMPVSSDNPRHMSSMTIPVATVFLLGRKLEENLTRLPPEFRSEMLVYTAVDHCDADPFPVKSAIYSGSLCPRRIHE